MQKHSHRVVSVTFQTAVQQEEKRVWIPQEIRDILGIKHDDPPDLALKIWDSSGLELFVGEKSMESGNEIYGARDVGRVLKKGEAITVRATLPAYGGPL